ncbi:DUF1850 domain-containing protein [Pseudomonas stutzeri]|uniref:DUF1850 domain-containing protein n=1 Tax=Stutzerimonas stutzeri TaxID=316 RepID=A0A2N8SS13_STUST|nr:DUF1850 domain-containing protein [Stutzerimonas stutzeri]EQM79306.1 hypothetical protein L686_11480 [Stutzerimonas stutzeri MF28]MCI0917561.1 DUF1850 domain-containing protein [Stutzerimonas stutzeri]MCQ4250409.1 DUF1850 domain-containing protein [Stutzerimonas stutzeri]PNG05273.1 DUF1850 domain-containing protein [Stutzerimonas stutzeri]
MIGLCLGLAGVVWAQVPTADFTLAWTHTIEKIRWEEDYRVTPDGLLLGEARVKGSGAGMEIPDGAELRDGTWHYQRQLPPLQPLRLGRTPEAGDFQLCFDQRCHAMSEWLGPPKADRPALELWSCAVQADSSS